MRSVRDLVRHPAAGPLAGLLGAILVAVGTVGLSYTGFGTTTADSTYEGRWVGRLVMLPGLALLLAAWWSVRRLPGRYHWGLLALWSLPLLFAPPVLSRDMYAYAEQGYLVLQGLDPYTVAMSSRGGPFAELVDVFWRGTTTVYPPGALWVQRLVVALTGAHPYWSVVAMRLPAIGGLVLMGTLAPRLAAAHGVDAALVRWAVLLNPLAVLHIIGGGHNDALAGGLAVLAVWLSDPRTNGGRRWGWLLGSAVAGVAASIKQPLVIVVVAAAALAAAAGRVGTRRLADLAVRTVVGTAVAAAAFALVAALTGLGYGWLRGSGAPYSVKTTSPASVLADLVSVTGLVSFPTAVAVTTPLLLVSGVAAMAVWSWRTLVVARDAAAPVRFLAGSFLLLVVAFPGFQAWYLLWGGAFAAAIGWVERSRVAVVAVLVYCLAVGWLTECVGVAPLWSALAGIALAWLAAILVRLRTAPDHPLPRR